MRLVASPPVRARSVWRYGVTAAVWGALTAHGSIATAQAAPSDPVAAQTLFEQARNLMRAGHYAEACPKLVSSQRLDPGTGTLLNLGDCLEHNGQTASAWEAFGEAASAAASSKQHDREVAARARMHKLEPRLCRVGIRVEGDVTEVVVAWDGRVLDRALLGTAVPVDPGQHVLRATGPNIAPWERELQVDAASCPATTQTISVVPLAQAARKPTPHPTARTQTESSSLPAQLDGGRSGS